MDCIICGDPTPERRKTCSEECKNKRLSQLASARRKAGIVKNIEYSNKRRRPYSATWHGSYEK